MSTEATSWQEPSDGGPGHHRRISGPHNIRNQAELFDARARDDARAAAAPAPHSVLGERLLASGGAVRGMVEELRHEGVPRPEQLRPLADAFGRHCLATEATARRALDDRHAAGDTVRRDREEGEYLRRVLRQAMAGETPDGVYALTVAGVLAEIDQYLLHEGRDLVSAVDRELPLGESEHLGERFGKRPGRR